MGRKRTTNEEMNLPPKLYPIKNKDGGFRYYYGRKRIPLGTELDSAKAIALSMSAQEKGKATLGQLVGASVQSEAEILLRATKWACLCGVYFLIHKCKVVYVGQSKKIMWRIAQHASRGMEFDSVSWVECAEEDLDRLERAYIYALKPTLNKALINMPRAKVRRTA